MTRRPTTRSQIETSRRFIELFIDMLNSEEGAATNTIDAYGRDLNHLQNFLSRRRQTLLSATTNHIRDYLRELSEAGMAASTISRRLSSIRRFYKFIRDERIREDDPSNSLKSPKLNKPLPKWLSEEEVGRLLEVAQNRTGAAILKPSAPVRF